LPIIEAVRPVSIGAPARLRLPRNDIMSRIRLSLVTVGCSALMAMQAAAAWGQAGYGQMAVGATPNFHTPGSYERVSGRSNPALTFFGGAKARKYAPAGRSQPMPPPQPLQTGAMMKPYSGVQQTSGVTPYLALDQLETQEGLPNYYLYVKPSLDQSQMNQAQQVQNRRMQQQMRRATTAGIMPTGTSGGMPTTGHSSQFMNNGGYYPALRK
jgi:hypothetical protein